MFIFLLQEVIAPPLPVSRPPDVDPNDEVERSVVQSSRDQVKIIHIFDTPSSMDC